MSVFVSLEGIDGCGKSTQAARLAAWLEASGRRVVRVREPGGTPVSEQIRAILLSRRNTTLAPVTELLLYAAARAQLVAEVIAPALAEGTAVIADRFHLATAAYQGYGRGLDLEGIASLAALACGDTRPRHTFVLDIPVEAMAGRLGQAGKEPDRMESQGREFFARVREGYLELARRDPAQVTVLDGMLPAEELHGRIRRRVADLWPVGLPG